MRDTADLRARIALSWLTEPGHRHLHALVAQDGAAAALAQALDGRLPDERLRAAVAARLRAADPRRIADAALHSADRLGAALLTPDHPDWPPQLGDLARLDDRAADHHTRPPLLLW
ncbi:MAG TPA: DNA processing protein DprA, partial [Pilimelia sp.]|nr:DNA processing protein DprA [Pilimelia sp.]